jgi:hypothetical protein
MGPRLGFVTSLLLVLVLFAAIPATAANVAVGTCMPTKVSFDSLTDAVQGVPAGSTIQVCPGIYAEQIVINKSLTLKGIVSGNNSNPVLVPPAGGLVTNAFGLNAFSFYGFGTPFAAQIVIQGGVDVTLSGITIDDSAYNIPTCNPIVVGILVQDSNVTVNGVALRNQLETGPPPCPSNGIGSGILVQNDAGTGSPTTAKVTNSTFVNAAQAYEADGVGVTSTVNNNSFTASTNSNWNAISIDAGMSTIQGNSIADFNFPPAATNLNFASYAVYMSCVPGGTVAGNTISSTQVGVILVNPTCPTTAVSINNNNITNASIIGIDVGETNGYVQGNDIRTAQTAIRIPGAAAGNTIQNNRINDVCAAFGSNPTAGANNILSNTIFNATNLSITNATGFCP